jgi:flagellar motor switch protein FliM
MLAARKLAAQMAEACSRALARTGQAPWRVTLDRIDEGLPLAAASEITPARLESELGSLTAYLWMDRQAASALMEAALGGTGTEAAFAMPDRQFSRIEADVMQLAATSMTQELMHALSRELARPFSLFESNGRPEPPEDASQLVSFHFIVNLFSYDGEIRIALTRNELLQQIGARGEAENMAAGAARQQLQLEIGRSELILTVSLGQETLSVEDISNLAPGRLLELASTASMPVTVWSSGVAAYQGTLARAGDRLAVCLTTALT